MPYSPRSRREHAVPTKRRAGSEAAWGRPGGCVDADHRPDARASPGGSNLEGPADEDGIGRVWSHHGMRGRLQTRKGGRSRRAQKILSVRSGFRLFIRRLPPPGESRFPPCTRDARWPGGVCARTKFLHRSQTTHSYSHVSTCPHPSPALCSSSRDDMSCACSQGGVQFPTGGKGGDAKPASARRKPGSADPV